MQTVDVQSVEIRAPFGSTFDYIADPETLPQWTHAFAAAKGRHAVLRTPAGTAEIDLDVTAIRESGVIDWKMTFRDGHVAKAWSRLVQHAADKVTYTFVLPAPPAPLEQLEGMLAEQSKTLASELAILARIVEERVETQA
jgi:hypothetical protein